MPLPSMITKESGKPNAAAKGYIKGGLMAIGILIVIGVLFGPIPYNVGMCVIAVAAVSISMGVMTLLNIIPSPKTFDSSTGAAKALCPKCSALNQWKVCDNCGSSEFIKLSYGLFAGMGCLNCREVFKNKKCSCGCILGSQLFS